MRSAEILAAPAVTYEYRTKPRATGLIDLTQVEKVTVSGVSTETYDYSDAEGRLKEKTLTLATRTGQPLTTSYLYDSLDRVTDVYYPKQYGVGTAGSEPRKVVHHDYDIASRLSELKVDSVSYASALTYNAASQTTALTVGAAGGQQVTESYDYDPVTGLLSGQTVKRGDTKLLDLAYDYLRPGTSAGRTGQLTRITNQLNRDKDRSYSYDALGRLVKATGGGGATPLWTQVYSYDRYGNRKGATATGTAAPSDTARLQTPELPQPAFPTAQLAAKQEVLLPAASQAEAGRMLSDSPLRPWSFGAEQTAAANARANHLGAGRSVAAGGAALTAIPQPQSTLPGVIINEFRLRGPGGAADEYVELYNYTGVDITVSAGDGSAGWALVAPASDGTLSARFVVPNGTVIPAVGHYLGVGTGYSLQGIANGDKTYQSEIADNTVLALFTSTTPANWVEENRLDAVGFSTVTNPLLHKGTGLAPIAADNLQHCFVRKVKATGGGGTGQAINTQDNAADFLFISTTAALSGGVQSGLGAPGPENLRSPTVRNRYMPASLVDPLASASTSPNRERNSSDTGVNKTYGTLAIRRSYRNMTGLPVTRLRWRIINITTLHGPGYSDPAQADVRALSSTNVLVTRQDGSQVEVQGTTLEAPPQAQGGGLNATLGLGTITLGSPLAHGSSVQVQFLLGIERLGNFSFYVNVEAVTATGQPVVGPPVPADGFTTEATATTTKLVFDEGTNRITTAGFVYDAAGNQTQIVRADGSIQRLRYDAAGRLVKVQNQQGQTLETTTYGADSQRLMVQAGDENSPYRTYYAWSGSAVLAEYSEGYTSTTVPQWTKSYVYLGARLLLTLEPGSTGDYIEYHHPDRLGTRLVSNNANLSVVEQTTLPYGVPLDAESNGATTRRFTSYERSASTGLDYAINRHYDAVQGRFTQVDPIGMEATTHQIAR